MPWRSFAKVCGADEIPLSASAPSSSELIRNERLSRERFSNAAPFLAPFSFERAPKRIAARLRTTATTSQLIDRSDERMLSPSFRPYRSDRADRFWSIRTMRVRMRMRATTTERRASA